MIEHRPSIVDKRRTFRELHASGCFAIPNPWDLGSACYLQSLGFKALASTSSGFAWSQARADNGVSRERVLAHLAELVAGTNVPINADFESGFAPDAAGVKQSVGLALEAGVAGLSIEDSTGVASKPLFEVQEAVLRIRAARAAMDKSGGDAILVGRAECYLVGHPDLAETITRLQAYANAGADCVYAPGIRSPDDIRAIVDAVAPTPFNLLVGWTSELSMQTIAALGVRRVSVGGALARAAWGGFMRAARAIAEQGSFAGFADGASGQALNQLFTSR